MKPETTIENIRSMLANSTMTSPELMQELADSFNDTTSVFNRRMQACAELIKAGNTIEAVRLADEHPRLLDFYVLLNFDELDDWYAAMTQFTDSIPVPLNTEHYQLIRDAYVYTASMDDWFRQYRLANLTNVPMREKLLVLRSIAEKDTSNFFWLEDVEQFERVRQEELKDEINAALTAQNQQRLEAIYRDIKGQTWRVSPQNLITQILHPVLLSKVTMLQDYCSNYDFDNVARVYSELQNMLTAENITAPQDVSNAMNSAKDFLADVERRKKIENRKQQFIAAKDALESALSRRSSIEELQYLYNQLLSVTVPNVLPIPNQLTVQFEDRIAELENERRVAEEEKEARSVKQALLVIGIIGVIVVIVLLLQFLGLN
ncbi:MAG: hypothetical protein LBU65_12825 [Planctomycetaceae bacterium]|jgi:hypothetical protein|nr:hypothetical protein [Planctomycetaceae bacterium]